MTAHALLRPGVVSAPLGTGIACSAVDPQQMDACFQERTLIDCRDGFRKLRLIPLSERVRLLEGMHEHLKCCASHDDTD